MHLVPDALSRLPPKMVPESDSRTYMLEDVGHVFYALIVGMSIEIAEFVDFFATRIGRL